MVEVKDTYTHRHTHTRAEVKDTYTYTQYSMHQKHGNREREKTNGWGHRSQ